MLTTNIPFPEVVKCYYNCVKSNKMKLEDVPTKPVNYRELVEIYWNEVEKNRAHS